MAGILICGAAVISASGSGVGCRFEKILGEALQHPAGGIDQDLLGRVQAAGDRRLHHFPVAAVDDQGQPRAGQRIAQRFEGGGLGERLRFAMRDWTVNLLGFVPFGWLVVRWRCQRPGIFLATVLAAGISTTIEVGQLLIFNDRVPSTEDILMNTLGAALGAGLPGRRGLPA